MTRSMTGFANAEREIQTWLLGWEVRSVNHRYFDLSLRLPEGLRFLEADARARIAACIKRGRVDGTLSCKKVDQGGNAIQINGELLRGLLDAAAEVETRSGRALAPFNALDVLRWPGVLREAEINRDELAAAALALLAETLNRAVAARETEGRQLAALIEDRCLRIREQVAAVRGRVPSVLQSIRQKILARIAELAVQPDTDRLEQEIAYLAQKLDVAEELDRLDAHVEEVLRSLGQTEPVGRRLDFLLQEMNREANTLGSKSADTETTRASIEMKVLIEQIREQVQNIE
jgi:uncharacterized protein (TIGR00255 family)